MHLSCNFVNVYTIAYTYTRASLTDILARKSARVGQVGEDVCVGVGVCVGPVEFQLNLSTIIYQT